MAKVIPKYDPVLDAERDADIQDGTAQGQLPFWDATLGKWTYSEVTERFWDDTNKRQGFGTANPGAKVEILSSTEQIRASYSASVYSSWTTDSAGYSTVTSIGDKYGLGLVPGAAGQGFTFDANTAIMDIKGTVKSLPNMPRLHFGFNGDNDPGIGYLVYAHDNLAISFDAYHNGTNWVSSDAGSNFAIYKNRDKLIFGHKSGATKGANFAAFNLSYAPAISANGYFSLGLGQTTEPARRFEVVDSLGPQQRWSYNPGSVYCEIECKSTGIATFSATGNAFNIGGADNAKALFGAGSDMSIYYDGTNAIINPKEVGSGILDVLGVIQSDGYNSSDGSAGATGSFTAGSGETVTVKDGLIVSIV